MEVIQLIGAFITLLGSNFLLLGSIGVFRMPDIYNRIQAGTKATTLGTILSLLGLVFFHPEWGGKIFILILFIILTNPVSSHVLARAAHFAGIYLSDKTVVDKLGGADNTSEEVRSEF